jgi:hypothetical protein
MHFAKEISVLNGKRVCLETIDANGKDSILV